MGGWVLGFTFHFLEIAPFKSMTYKQISVAINFVYYGILEFQSTVNDKWHKNAIDQSLNDSYQY